MAKKATEKKESLKDMSVQELQVQLKESQEKQFRMRFQRPTNVMQIRDNRRSIARILTFLHQKEKVS